MTKTGTMTPQTKKEGALEGKGPEPVDAGGRKPLNIRHGIIAGIAAMLATSFNFGILEIGKSGFVFGIKAQDFENQEAENCSLSTAGDCTDSELGPLR